MFVSRRPKRHLKDSTGRLFNYGPGVRGATAKFKFLIAKIEIKNKYKNINFSIDFN